MLLMFKKKVYVCTNPVDATGLAGTVLVGESVPGLSK